MTLFTEKQLLGFKIATRISSVASILGSIFVLSTFSFFPSFRTTKTRLIVYATVGNLLGNFATLISVSAMPTGTTKASPLCQTQAFLIQWFLLADPFWVFCMALNVYLIFMFKRFDGRHLRKLEKWYFLFAYGITSVGAFGHLIHDLTARRKILGPAIIWCWVTGDPKWEYVRVGFFYAEMWILAFATICIYTCVAFKIYKVKIALSKVKGASETVHAPATGAKLNDPLSNPQDGILVTTDILHNVQNENPASKVAKTELNRSSLACSASKRSFTAPAPVPALGAIRSSTPNSSTKSADHRVPFPSRHMDSPLGSKRNTGLVGRYKATAYATPLAPAERATLPGSRLSVFRPLEHAAHIKRNKENSDAIAYFKTAILLFMTLIVVWLPPSINRVQEWQHPGEPNYTMQLMSAFVLPMQGFCNAIVYAQATPAACRHAFDSIMAKFTGGQLDSQPVHEERIRYNSSVDYAQDIESSRDDVPKEENHTETV